MTYLVFAYEQCYPRGGAKDLKSIHLTLKEAKAAANDEYEKFQRRYVHDRSLTADWCGAHVLRVDGEKHRIVFKVGF